MPMLMQSSISSCTSRNFGRQTITSSSTHAMRQRYGSTHPVVVACQKRAQKSVTVLNTGHEKARVTVILTARTDGFKLPPFVLLPKKRIVPEIVKRFKNKLVLSWSGRTWMDNELTTKYIEEVFGNFFFGNRLLIWDSFRCHISADIKQTLKRLAIHTAVVPGGTTKYIQVPDVSWNAPFKNSIRELHSDWMIHGEKPTTSGGDLRAPPMEIYLGWIVSAWESLSKDVIVKSFISCGVTKEDEGKNDALIHVYKKDGAIPNGLAIAAAPTRRGYDQIGRGKLI